MARSSYYGNSFSEFLHSSDRNVGVPEREVVGPVFDPPADMEWMEDGLCRQTDPELFYPDPENGVKSGAEAKKICRRCPVKTDCLEYALTAKIIGVNGYELGYVEGIWAGTSAGQRRRIRVSRGVTTRAGWTYPEEHDSVNLYTEGGDDAESE